MVPRKVEKPGRAAGPVRRWGGVVALAAALAAAGAAAAADGARPDTMVLTAAEVRRLALEYNRDYLQALEEVRAADAEVVK
ncbi:MAG TPA: hypothetical protein PK112_08225, partial [candidate division Zixibacteria bacterium]|nr:hypothetical protein [candidate division Zixibacteria bacterium]